MSATDKGRLHLVPSDGSLLLEEGNATGTLPGKITAHLDVGPTLTATFTIHAAGGTLTGHGSAKLTRDTLYTTFGGTLQITGGSGRYTHAKGQGGLYGSINRETYAMNVETTGTITY